MMTTVIDKAEALIRADFELSLDEALLLLAIPTRDIPMITSLVDCQRCSTETDEDGFCSRCGEVSLALR